jgi:hypothetical protein
MVKKSWIEDVFSAPVKSCKKAGSGIGLQVAFSESVNIATLLNVHENLIYTNQSLCDLVNEHSFLVLDNATIKDIPFNVEASGSNPEEDYGFLTQDPFHRDEHWGKNGQCRSIDGHVTVLYNLYGCARRAPTYYAYADSVKAAIHKLSAKDIPTSVVSAVAQQSSDQYRFTFHPNDLKARESLQTGWPEYTRHVFDLIPSDQKYQQHWRENERTMILFSNQPHLFHGRPASNDTQNMLQSLDISPDIA